jgi:DNA-binding MarR family transcriptional regulator
MVGASNRVRAWREIMLTHARVTSALDEVLQREIGIPGAWYEALVEIALAGGTMQMSQFAAETTLTKSGATRFVDRLEAAGLVSRFLCPTDRRVIQLALTEKGRSVQRASDPHALGVLGEEFGQFIDDEEASVIADALRRTRLHPAPT